MTDDKRAGLVREIDALLREDHGTTDATVLLRVARDQIVEDGKPRDGNFLDGPGCCKVCDGEIPDGHMDNCDIWKIEKRARQLEAALRKYGHHLPLCAAWDAGTWRGSDAAICNCGLAQSLAAAGGTAPPTTTEPGEDEKKLQRLVDQRDGALQRDRARAVNASWDQKDAEFPAADKALRDEFERLSAALKEAQRQIALIPPDLLTAYRMALASAARERDIANAISKQLDGKMGELKEALARAASCEQDAARYEWIKANKALRNPEHAGVWALTSNPIIRGPTLDAAIDAALASAGQAKERG